MIFAILLYMVVALLLGAHCVDYCLWAVFGQDVAMWADMLVAVLFTGPILVPSLVLWILGAAGIAYPLIQ